ncbi:hypothetical protein O5477_26765, partial [Escherichia coli]|nr:hypothetical protein [Escherichia coli]
VVQCQNDRSQHKNKDQAFKQLRAKLYEFEMQKKNADKQTMEDNKSDSRPGDRRPAATLNAVDFPAQGALSRPALPRPFFRFDRRRKS